jgi:hypothetical protein
MVIYYGDILDLLGDCQGKLLIIFAEVWVLRIVNNERATETIWVLPFVVRVIPE